MTRQQLSEEVKWKRMQLKENQEQFGKRFGVSRTTVRRWESPAGRKPGAKYRQWREDLLEFVHDCDYEVRGGFRIKKRNKR
jgi:transcriptional regulator with XRE-family HTH domain